VNPFRPIRPIGKPNVGKPQLRRDEAKKLVELLMQHTAEDNPSALALLVQLLLGMRSSEVLNLRKRDIDGDGTLLIVEGTKTKNARRLLALPPVLREPLARRVASLAPESLIFADMGRSNPLATDHLLKNLRKFCKLAGIPQVCPHSLRGLHSSLAVEAGATSTVVAAALGHGSDAITRKHYIAPSALDAARASRVSAALLDSDLDPLISALRSLSPAQLERVLSAVGTSR
jgi:integrase